MATLAVMIGGAAINALAFSGSNYLFSKLSDYGKAENQKHDLAIEDFQKAKNEWNKERVKRLDFINKKLREQQDARQAITDRKDGMRVLSSIGSKDKAPVSTTQVHQLLSSFRNSEER